MSGKDHVADAGKKAPPCKWLSDDFNEICCNGDCPACADFCPAVDLPGLCRYEEREEKE